MAENQKSVKQDKPKGEKKNRNTHGVSVSAKTNGYGLISIIILIGMIATIFLAASYSGQGDFLYFSPNVYLTGLSSSNVFLSETWLPLSYNHVLGRGMLEFGYSIAYIVYDDILYESDRVYFKPNPEDPFVVYEFNIGGTYLKSEPVLVDYADTGEPIYQAFLHVPAMSYDLFGIPNINVVSDAWSDVNRAKDIFFALRVTGNFIRDSVKYEVRLCQNILPWNSVQSGNREWIDDIWKQKDRSEIK